MRGTAIAGMVLLITPLVTILLALWGSAVRETWLEGDRVEAAAYAVGPIWLFGSFGLLVVGS